MHSLPHVSRRTMQHDCRIDLSPHDFRFFSHPVTDPFQLSLTVLVRYRSRIVFRVCCRCQQCSRAISNARYFRTPPDPSNFLVTGLSPSTAPPSRGLRLQSAGVFDGPHHIYRKLSLRYSVCPVRFSIAFTCRIAFAFSSCGY